MVREPQGFGVKMVEEKKDDFLVKVWYGKFPWFVWRIWGFIYLFVVCVERISCSFFFLCFFVDVFPPCGGGIVVER